MAGFTCPHCQQIMVDNINTHVVYHSSFDSSDFRPPLADARFKSKMNTIDMHFYKCPNSECQKPTIIARGLNDDVSDLVVHIYPQSNCKHFPDYIPKPIRKDYEEACAILYLSPKASATLSRRCLQGMIHDFWGIKEKTLNAELTSLKGKVPEAQWKAIDGLRELGNIGAHMEKDVNTIVDIYDGEAEKLIMLIEILLRNWYVNRYEEERLYSDISRINNQKQQGRQGR